MNRKHPGSTARPAARILLAIAAATALLAACGQPTGLLRPNGVAVMPDNTLYIMDRGNYRVVHTAADAWTPLGSWGPARRTSLPAGTWPATRPATCTSAT